MVAAPHGRHWSVDEYLWLERNSLVKHEYLDTKQVFDSA